MVVKSQGDDHDDNDGDEDDNDNGDNDDCDGKITINQYESQKST